MVQIIISDSDDESSMAIMGLVIQAVAIENKFQEMDKAIAEGSSSASYNQDGSPTTPLLTASQGCHRSSSSGGNNLSREICRSIIKAYVKHSGISMKTF